MNYLLEACKLAAHSPDPRTQNGAVVIGSHSAFGGVANNAWPLGVWGTWERPAKYLYVEHAERAAIYQAARYGVPLVGGTMYCTWAACADCARAIISCGIVRLIVLAGGETPDRWSESVRIGDEMLADAGVVKETVKPDCGLVWPSFRRNDRMWNPITGWEEEE